MKESTKSQAKSQGRYVYCLADSGQSVTLGNIGIENSEVYTIPYQEVCAVAHDCPTEPYDSKDEKEIKKWVVTHEEVVDRAWEKFGTVLPLTFDTIIKSEGNTTPEENVKKWIQEDYENLVKKIERIKGKVEYGVQIFWNPKAINNKIEGENPQVEKLKEKIDSMSKGKAYLYKQKLEKLKNKEMEKEADSRFKEFYKEIKEHVDDIQKGKTRKVKGEDKQMLLNLSCLVYKDKDEGLGAELGKINRKQGFSVKFTGPWPPYSFVSPRGT